MPPLVARPNSDHPEPVIVVFGMGQDVTMPNPGSRLVRVQED